MQYYAHCGKHSSRKIKGGPTNSKYKTMKAVFESLQMFIEGESASAEIFY